MPRMTNAQLAEALEKETKKRVNAEAKADGAAERAEQAEARAEYYENKEHDGVDALASDVPSVPVMTAEAGPETELADPEVLYDPYDAQNPHRIIEHPGGFRLGWKNPVFRENHRGWRGWMPVTYDDEIGRHLKSYLLDPPRRMEHAVDNYVRRGDSILCRLPEHMWLARRRKRTDKADRLAASHSEHITHDHVRSEKDLKPSAANPTSLGGRAMTS